MWSEDQLGGIERELLEDLASVTVSEDGVGGKVVGYRDEVGTRCGFLAGAGYSRLRIGDDATITVHKAGREHGRQCKNDGSCITAGIRHQSGRRYAVGIQLRQAIDGPFREFGRKLRVGIFESIDSAILFLLQPPRSTEIDDPQAPRHGFGDKFARNRMRRRQEQ